MTPSQGKNISCKRLPLWYAICNSYRNLVSCCLECNSLKGNRFAEAVGEFGGGQAGLAVGSTEKMLSEEGCFVRGALETTRDEDAVGIANCIPQWKPFARDIFALRGSHESIGERRAGASWRTYLLLSQRKFGILPVGNQNGGVKKQALL